MERFIQGGKCKNPEGCSNPVLLTDVSQLENSILGKGDASRCTDCLKKYKAALRRSQSIFIPGVDVSTEKRDDTLISGLMNFEQSGIKRKKLYPGTAKSRYIEKFQHVDGEISQLTADLSRYFGPRIHWVCFATGSGKSSYLLAKLSQTPLAREGMILCAEPCLAMLKPKDKTGAGTLPYFTATELLQAPGIGKGCLVGMLFRGERNFYDPVNNRLVYLTDGTVMRMIVSGDLERVRVLVVDEAHMKSSNMCMIFTMIKMALVMYPDLQVIFASATADPADWIEYYSDYEVNIIQTTGPRVFQYPLTIHWPVAGTEGGEKLSGYREAFGYVSKVPGLSLDILDDVTKSAPLIVKAIKEGHIGQHGRDEDILVYAPTVKKITDTIRNIDALGIPGLKTYAAHGKMSAQERKRLDKSELAVAKGTCDHQRVIVATNYVETGVTIDFTYEIESGTRNLVSSNPDLATDEQSVVDATKDFLMQRWGRGARIKPAEVFCLYSKDNFEGRPDWSEAEIMHERLDKHLLTLLRCGFRDLENIDIFGLDRSNPRIQKEIKRAIRQLQISGAMDERGEITQRGLMMEETSTSTVNFANMIGWAEVYGYTVEIATFIAFVEVDSLDQLFEDSDEGTFARERWRIGCLDDLEMYLRIFMFVDEKREELSNKQFKQWCLTEGLNSAVINKVDYNRQQLMKNYERGTHCSQTQRVHFDIKRIHRVRASIARSMPEWIFVKDEAGEFVPFQPGICALSTIDIDRSSSCAISEDMEAFVCINRTMVKDKVYASHVVEVDPSWLEYMTPGEEMALEFAVEDSMAITSRFTESVSTRLRELTEKPNLADYPKGKKVSLQVVRAQHSSDKGYRFFLAKCEETGALVPVSLKCSQIEIGEVFRAYVEGTSKDKAVIRLTQRPIKERLVKDAPILENLKITGFASNSDDKRHSVFLRVEPGVEMMLKTRELGNLRDGISHLEVGDTLSVKPKAAQTVDDRSVNAELSGGAYTHESLVCGYIKSKASEFDSSMALNPFTSLDPLHFLGDDIHTFKVLHVNPKRRNDKLLVVADEMCQYLLRATDSAMIEISDDFRCSLKQDTEQSYAWKVTQDPVRKLLAQTPEKTIYGRIRDKFSLERKGRDESSPVAAIVVESGIEGIIFQDSLYPLEALYDDATIGDTFPINVTRYQKGRLTLTPYRPEFYEGQLVYAVVTSVSKPEDNLKCCINFALAPQVRGVMFSSNLASLFNEEHSGLIEGEKVLVVIEGRNTRSKSGNKTEYLVAPPSAHFASVDDGEIFQGVVVKHQMTRGDSFLGNQVRFHPCTRPGLVHCRHSEPLTLGQTITVRVNRVEVMEGDRGNYCRYDLIPDDDYSSVQLTGYSTTYETVYDASTDYLG